MHVDEKYGPLKKVDIFKKSGYFQKKWVFKKMSIFKKCGYFQEMWIF